MKKLSWMILLFMMLTPWLSARDSDIPQLFEFLSGKDGKDQSAVVYHIDLSLLLGEHSLIRVDLPDQRYLTARFTYLDWTDEDRFSWFGEVDMLDGENIGAGTVAMHYIDGRILGDIYLPEAEYQLKMDGENHLLTRVEHQKPGVCSIADHQHEHDMDEDDEQHQLSANIQALTGSSDNDCFVPGTTTVVDLMVIYPRTLNYQEVYDFAVAKTAEANNIFVNSQVSVSYNLVSVAPITGPQPPENVQTPTVLAWLNDQFDTPALNTEVEHLRNASGADFVMVIIPPHPALNCGVANLPEIRNGIEVDSIDRQPFNGRAFSVMEINCGNSDRTFAHELGHNWGMHHHDNRNTRSVYPWAYGYVLPNGTRATLMACKNPTTPCGRLPIVSNPDLTWRGIPLGLHTSQSSTPAHNACVANLRRTMYRNFNQPPPTSPPVLTINSADPLSVVQGKNFFLSASATDAQDGNLAGSISWTSDRAGFLGTGGVIAVNLTLAGQHIVTASVNDSSGTTVVKSLFVNVTEGDPPRRWIDVPAHNQTYNGVITVKGWATDASGVDSWDFELNGNPITLTNFRITHRQDVCNVHSDLQDPNCPFVGWEGELDTQNLENKQHQLTGTFSDIHGNTSTFTRSFFTSNTATTFVNVAADAWVNEDDPTRNYGGEGFLYLRGSGSGLANHVYLKFVVNTINNLPRPISSIKLHLRTGANPLQGLQVYRLATTTWTEFGINWNNAPLDPMLSFPTSTHPANTTIEIDISSIVSQNGTYTIGLVSPDAPGQYILSKETPFSAPYISITY